MLIVQPSSRCSVTLFNGFILLTGLLQLSVTESLCHFLSNDDLLRSLTIPILNDRPVNARDHHVWASPMSPAQREGIERMGPVFAQLYGQTEWRTAAYGPL